MKSMTFAKRAVGVAAAALLSFGAHAANLSVDVGPVVAGDTFSQVIQKSVGAFLDKWSFTVAAPTFAAGSVSNLAIAIPNLSLYNIDNLSAQLYTGANVLVDDLDDNLGSSADYKVGSGLLAPDSYYFTISGNANGNFGGQYVFAVTTLPVPEPESYAMFLAGLGIMGAIAVRRNKAKKG